MGNNTPWPEYEIETLKRMWASGFSASEISRALHGVRSRNAVIGKVSRLGLSASMENRRGPPPPKNKLKKPPRRTAAQRQAFGKTEPRQREQYHLSAELRALHDLEPLDPSMTILDAPLLACRYMRSPLGAVCGRVAEDGAWCPQHRRLVYRPDNQREADVSRRIERLAALR